MTLEELRRSNRDTILPWRCAMVRRTSEFSALSVAVKLPIVVTLICLAELRPERSLTDLGGLLMNLRASIGVRVDVAAERMLRPEVRRRLIAEAIPL